MSRNTIFLLFILISTLSLRAQTSRENFKFAKFKYDNGLYSESLSFINKSLKEDSAYISAYLLRANIYYELGQYYNSVLDINRIIKIENEIENAEYYFMRGKSFLAIDDFSNAKKDFDKAKAIQSENSKYYYFSSMLEFLQLHYNEAIDEIDKAILYDADSPDFYALRSEIKMQFLNPVPSSEHYQSIMADINVAIALAPENEKFYIIRSEFLSKMGEEQAALDDYNKILSLSPKKEEAYTNRGVIKMNKFDYQSAALDFTKSIVINPDDERNYRYRGLCYNNLSNFEDALKDFSKSIDLLVVKVKDTGEEKLIKNTLAETYLLRGHCLNLMGNNARACRDFLAAHNLGIKKGLNYYRKFCGIY